MAQHPNMTVEQVSYSNDMKVESMAPERIESDQLKYLKIDSETIDLKRVHELLSDLEDPEEVFQLCGWSKSQNLEETREFVSSREEKWNSDFRYEYLLISKDSEEYIGTAYLDFSDNLTNCEIGYWLRKPYWGRELSSELAETFVYIAFEEFDSNYLSVGCLESNQKSLKAIMKYIKRFNGYYTGMQPVDSKTYMDSEKDVLMHHEFAITSKQYHSGREGISTTVPKVKFKELDLL